MFDSKGYNRWNWGCSGCNPKCAGEGRIPPTTPKMNRSSTLLGWDQDGMRWPFKIFHLTVNDCLQCGVYLAMAEGFDAGMGQSLEVQLCFYFLLILPLAGVCMANVSWLRVAGSERARTAESATGSNGGSSTSLAPQRSMSSLISKNLHTYMGVS